MAELLAHVVRSELASLGSSLQVPYSRGHGGLDRIRRWTATPTPECCLPMPIPWQPGFLSYNVVRSDTCAVLPSPHPAACRWQGSEEAACYGA